MIFGNPIIGGSTQDLTTDTKYVARYTLTEDVRIVGLDVRLDGSGAGIGNQALRGVIYDTANNLVAASTAVTVIEAAAATWVRFSFLDDYPEGVPMVAGDYDLGVHAGTVSASVRIYYGSGGTSRTATDTYADGTAATFGTPTGDTRAYSVFATGFKTWVPPAVEEDLVGRWPFYTAQAELGAPGVITSNVPAVIVDSQTRCTCEWHGTLMDPETGSYALVNPEGPLAALVGYRIKVTNPERELSVYAYVTADADLTSDLSITRRLWLALELGATTELDVIVEEVL